MDGSLPFLDVLLSRNDDGSFSHQVFRKKMHTEKYLHANSHHFPAQKLGVLNTLVTEPLESQMSTTLKVKNLISLMFLVRTVIVGFNVLELFKKL